MRRAALFVNIFFDLLFRTYVLGAGASSFGSTVGGLASARCCGR